MIVADSPARAKILNIFGHTAAVGCPRCSQCAKKVGGVLNYAGVIVVPLRTNETFRKRQHPEHHQVENLLIKGALEFLDIDIVMACVIDPMHIVDAGVLKKIICFLFTMSKETPSQLDLVTVKKIEEMFLATRPFFPSEIQRKPRKFEEINHFKASECRILVIYVVYHLIKDVVDKALLNEILLLTTAIKILSSEKLCTVEKNLELAQLMLSDFVGNFTTFFGPNLTYVVHVLLHITDDVRLYGPLVSYSAYCFESYLRTVKNCVRVKNSTETKQLYNRFSETGFLKANPPKRIGLGTSKDGHLFFDYYCASGQKISGKNVADSFVQIESNGIVQPVKVKGFLQQENSILVQFQRFETTESAYFVETSAGRFDTGQIGLVRAKKILPKCFYGKVEDIQQKYFVLPEADSFLLQPFSHEMQVLCFFFDFNSYFNFFFHRHCNSEDD